jgi:hypothetical protein
MLFSPDVFIIGGGISRDHARFFSLLRARAWLAPARCCNDADIIGAALAANVHRAEKWNTYLFGRLRVNIPAQRYVYGEE